MNIALVGPGLMPIPPRDWGAIEILIWKHFQALQLLGHTVTIFNSVDLVPIVKEINTGKFDFVHVQYDEFIHFFLKHCKVPFCITSHYGYISKPEKWAKGYFSIFADFLSAPAIICLSSRIARLYIDAGYKGRLYVLKNGIATKEFFYKLSGNEKALCLGKIEPRKRQATVAHLLDGRVDIDFVGPLADPEFKEGKTCRYGGVWTRAEVAGRLTEYSALLLLSDGEAAPLVVPEALAAGLSLVISESASANLGHMPYIAILPDGETDPELLASVLTESVRHNAEHRNDIRKYACEVFDNDVIMKEYEGIIVDVISNPPPRPLSTYWKKYRSRYIFSRAWFVLSKISFLREIRASLK